METVQISVDTDLDGEICKVAAYDVDVAGEIKDIARMTVKGHKAHTARRKSRIGKIAQKMSQTGIEEVGVCAKLRLRQQSEVFSLDFSG